MNPMHVHIAVRDTLEGLHVNNTAILRLIKMTILAESNFDDFMPREDLEENLYGLSRIEMAAFRNFVYDFIRHHPLRERIEEFCRVDLRNTSFKLLLRRLKYDLSFQIAVTYGIYASRFDAAPDNNLQAIAGCYLKYWQQTGFDEDDVSDLIDSYEHNFVSR